MSLNDENPSATIIMENGNEIEIELFIYSCPNTVYSFINAAFSGWFDNAKFYRVVKDFVIQAGLDDPYLDRECPYCLDGEFRENGFVNKQMSFDKGVVGMAGIGNVSSGATFFICTGKHERLDGKYPAFGKVVSGIKHVLDINEVECDEIMVGKHMMSIPFEEQTIKTIKIDLNGYEARKPNTIPVPDDWN